MKEHSAMTKYFLFMVLIIYANPIWGQTIFPNYLTGNSWDTLKWETSHSDHAAIAHSSYKGINDDGLKVIYNLYSGYPDSAGWVIIHNDSIEGYTENNPVVLYIKTEAASDIELKFIDEDGSVFIKRYPMQHFYSDWNRIAVYLRDTEYAWGGDLIFGKLSSFEIAFSAKGSGTVLIDEIGIGRQGLLSGFFQDPFCEYEGYGFLQRRDYQILQEDPLVFEYLKILQDSSSSDKLVLPNQDYINLVSTFNNALAAMVFIIKNEKERAERILDFYASRIDSNNMDGTKQAFFVNKNPFGFYQQMHITDYSRGGDNENRWIGDNAWLLLAYKQYEKRYGLKTEYEKVVRLISNLIISLYKPVDDSSGYIQKGWENGDTFFNTDWHEEGNIDCYAALKSCGEKVYSEKIKKWLATRLVGDMLWYDNYTWRVLAYGEPAYEIISIPEYDTRFRNKIIIDGDSLYGFYPNPYSLADNVWCDGIGHMACAQWHLGDQSRAYFYANQFEPLILRYTLYGKAIAAIPYSANRSGEFAWVDTSIGAVSSSAWYIFAKNGFNPLDTLNKWEPTVIEYPSDNNMPQHYELQHNFPNPFNPSTTISFSLPLRLFVSLKVYDVLGREVAVLVEAEKPAGKHSVQFNASRISSGIYFYQIKADKFIRTKKMLLLK